MKKAEKHIHRKVELAKSFIKEAILQISIINPEERTPKNDHILKEASDLLYDAEKLLGHIETDKYTETGSNIDTPALFRKRRKERELVYTTKN